MKHVLFNEEICGLDEFIDWLKKDKRFREFGNYEIGRCLYEDVRKSYGNFLTCGDYSIGKKESYDCLDEALKYKEILDLYKRYLAKGRKV